MATVSVRYIVDDVDAAIDFYCTELGFDEVMHRRPRSRCSRAGTCGSCSAPRAAAAAAARRCPTGRCPEPGGWNRFQLEVDDIEATVARLREHGARFRNDIVTGVGGKQILVEDPSGNLVELFEPTREEARLAGG